MTLSQQTSDGSLKRRSNSWHLDSGDGADVSQAWAAVPDDVKPYVAFVRHPGHNGFLTTANARTWVEDNYPFAKATATVTVS